MRDPLFNNYLRPVIDTLQGHRVTEKYRQSEVLSID